MNDLYFIVSDSSSMFVGDENCVRKTNIKIGDLLYRVKTSLYADEETVYVHFKSGLIITAHNSAVKKLTCDI